MHKKSSCCGGRSREFEDLNLVVSNKIKIKHNKPLTYYWNNSAISPGTKWMEKLHSKIIEWCSKQEYKIIYSSANTAGEGEHKLLQFIRNNKENKYK